MDYLVFGMDYFGFVLSLIKRYSQLREKTIEEISRLQVSEERFLLPQVLIGPLFQEALV